MARTSSVFLAGLTFLLFAGVVLIELAALSTLLPSQWQAWRVPLRLAATVGVTALAASILLQRRRAAGRPVSPVREPVVESDTLSVGLKQTLFVFSVLMAVVGVLGLSAVLVTGFRVLAFLPRIAGALTLAFAAGGIIAAVQLRSSLAGIPSRRLVLPPPWMILLAFALVVTAGGIALRTRGGPSLDFVPLLFLGAALPPLAVLSIAAADVGLPPTARRVAVAAVAGGTLSGVAAVILEILLPGIVALLALPVGDMVREIIAIVDEGRFSDLLRSPAALLLLVEIGIVAPIVEEAVKPLGLIILGRRIQTPRDALLIGIACGAGFAIVENIMYEGGGIGLWTGITVVRGIGGALHPFGAGLVSLGWFAVFHRQEGAWRRLVHYYLIAVGAHALWNGASGVFGLLESADRGILGPVNLQGVIIDVGLMALFLAEGVGLVWAVRRIVQQVAAVQVPFAAPARHRALAVWGIACLGVLLPVALAGGSAVLKYLGSALIP